MRRVVGFALVLLGAFSLGGALLSRTYLADRLVVTPIDQYAQTVSVGTGTYLDLTAGAGRTADLVATRTVRGDVPASSEDVNVWDVSVVLETGDGSLVRAYVDRVAADRRTGESVACCGEAVDGTATPHSGVSYKFPFDAGKQDYLLWDPNSRRSYAAKFVSEDEVKGTRVHKYIQQIPGQELRRQDVPGRLVNDSAPTVSVSVWYQNTRTVWVEPTTGVIVKGNEQSVTTFRDASGQDRATFLSFDLTFDDDSQTRQIDLAEDSRSEVRMVSFWLPLGGAILGLILVAVGVLVLRGDRRSRPVSSDEPPVPVAGAAP